MARRRRLGRSFYRRDPRVVAPELLGKLLVRGPLAARLVEVEAYCGSVDPGSHTYRGQTARNATMFGPPGGLYVYRIYGMHFCMNAVCGEVGEGVAVLLRAAVPEQGLEQMRANRPKAQRDVDLCRGPGRLCQAFGVDGGLDGVDLVTASGGITIVDDGVPPPARPLVTTRIGLTAGAEHLWRWCTAEDPHVSGPRALRSSS